ncbi:hypothetical protein FKW77_006152 [Venturia effusa]|uniref:Uncharacterized protein n=1 Tax=Venturia effusa TaxID=50376 RepID=A0A517L9G4_9PEZI|nr:hypothetical protein FKW77_006152 [Venturia effusa]
MFTRRLTKNLRAINCVCAPTTTLGTISMPVESIHNVAATCGGSTGGNVAKTETGRYLLDNAWNVRSRRGKERPLEFVDKVETLRTKLTFGFTGMLGSADPDC